jgi:molybdate transport system regulatory protein
MKYGARNQIEGKITKIKKGDVMGQVTLEIPADSVMNSVMTTESIEDLGIKEGESIKVIVKAINVLLVRE